MTHNYYYYYYNLLITIYYDFCVFVHVTPLERLSLSLAATLIKCLRQRSFVDMLAIVRDLLCSPK